MRSVIAPATQGLRPDRKDDRSKISRARGRGRCNGSEKKKNFEQITRYQIAPNFWLRSHGYQIFLGYGPWISYVFENQMVKIFIIQVYFKNWVDL